MTVCKKIFNKNDYKSQRGSTMTEVVLSIAVMIAVAPFMYNQIRDMSRESQDIAFANQIVSVRDDVVNFLRMNQGLWDNVAEIKLSEEEIEKLTPMAHSAFVDKYTVNGAAITDVYLAFDIDMPDIRVANIAKQIGEDAAIVREDGIAYSQNWAVSAPEDFNVGDLIFRISRDFDGTDKTRFLHRGTMGEDNLNQMQRNLHMNNFNMFNVGAVDALSAKMIDVDAVFLDADVVDVNNLYFSSGANLSSSSISIGSMRVTGDTSGFRTIKATKLNSDKYTTNGRLIVDKATVANSVNVAGNLILKSTSTNNVRGFTSITTNKLLTPYLSASDIVFFEDFGLTVSGELLLSSNAPLTIGSWTFPSTTPPSFSKFILTRASLPNVPDAHEFKALTSKDWQTR